MTAIPTWLQGRHLTAVTVIPQTVAGDGTLSAGASSALQALATSIALRSNPDREDISPVTTTRRNMVITQEMTTVDIEVLLKASGANPLADLASTADIFEVTFTRGAGGTAADTWSGFFIRGDFEETVASKGRNTCRMSFELVDIGSANPTYA